MKRKCLHAPGMFRNRLLIPRTKRWIPVCRHTFSVVCGPCMRVGDDKKRMRSPLSILSNVGSRVSEPKGLAYGQKLPKIQTSGTPGKPRLRDPYRNQRVLRKVPNATGEVSGMPELGPICFGFQVASTSQNPEVEINISFEKLASKQIK